MTGLSSNEAPKTNVATYLRKMMISFSHADQTANQHSLLGQCRQCYTEPIGIKGSL